MNTWQETFTIRTSEVGPNGRVTVPSICSFLQEAASNHAYRLQLSLEQLQGLNIFWALARLRVMMDVYPGWRDTIHVETWPSGDDGLYATREFLIFNEQAEVIGRASSNWVLLDMDKRRPVRLPKQVSELRVPERSYPIQYPAPRLHQPAVVDIEKKIIVRRSDLDLNRHVNNVRFVEWALEALPEDEIESRGIAELDILFRAETHYGDDIVSRAGLNPDMGDRVYEHAVIRTSDDREVALVRTRLAS